jgi:subtilisin family serine protease
VNAEGKASSFSTRGGHVALSAPGERVVSAGLHGYQMVTGTSFAAPFVAATAALLESRARRRSAPLEAEDVRRLLRASAQPWRPGEGDGGGAGILDAQAALAALDRELDGVGDEREPHESHTP